MGYMLQDALIGTCVLSGRLEQSALHRYVMGLTSSPPPLLLPHQPPLSITRTDHSCPASHGLVSKVIKPVARASGTFSCEPVVEKAIGCCFHVIREAMPGREQDGPEPFRHAFLRIGDLRFLDDGTHTIDGEERINLSRRQSKRHAEPALPPMRPDHRPPRCLGRTSQSHD